MLIDKTKEGQLSYSTSLILATSSKEKDPVHGLQCLREAMKVKAIPDEAKAIILKSWRIENP